MPSPRYWREVPTRFRLEASHCKPCGKTLYPARTICPDCRGTELEETKLSRNGKVVTSTVIHGATATTVSGWYERRAERETLAEERESTAAGLFEHDETAVPRISVDELSGMLGQPDPPIVLDVRMPSSYDRDGEQIPQSVRVPPDHVAEWDPGDIKERLIVAYCS